MIYRPYREIIHDLIVEKQEEQDFDAKIETTAEVEGELNNGN